MLIRCATQSKLKHTSLPPYRRSKLPHLTHFSAMHTARCAQVDPSMLLHLYQSKAIIIIRHTYAPMWSPMRIHCSLLNLNRYLQILSANCCPQVSCTFSPAHLPYVFPSACQHNLPMDLLKTCNMDFYNGSETRTGFPNSEAKVSICPCTKTGIWVGGRTRATLATNQRTSQLWQGT